MHEMYDYKFEDSNLETWIRVRQTWTLMQMSLEKVLGKIGLTPEQVSVLWICRDSEARGRVVVPAEIARILLRKDQTVTGLLNRLEVDGLVRRISKRRGHPFTEVKLTDKGREACDIGVASVKSVVSRTGDTSRIDGDLRKSLNLCLGDLFTFLADDLNMERIVVSPTVNW